jgi:hypothetical protein
MPGISFLPSAKKSATDHTDLHGLTFPIIRSCLIICKKKIREYLCDPWPAFLYFFRGPLCVFVARLCEQRGKYINYQPPFNPELSAL